MSSSCITIFRNARFGALGAYVRLSFTGRSSVRLFVCYLCIDQVGKLNFGAAKNDTKNGEKVRPKVVGASMRFTGPSMSSKTLHTLSFMEATRICFLKRAIITIGI